MPEKGPSRALLRMPLMHAFREAFANRDSRKASAQVMVDGEQVLAGRRNSVRQGGWERELRNDIAQDLRALLNTVNLDAAVDLADLGDVSRSILNYGLSDLTLLSGEEEAERLVAKDLQDTLRTFEPRLVANSVKVTRERGGAPDPLDLRYAVKAEMRGDPLDIPIEFVADVEIESVSVKVSGRKA